MKQAVLIGAGQYGRGVIGMLLSRSGYEVLLADVNAAVIEDINFRGEYIVRRIRREETAACVRNVRAMHAADPALIAECAAADLICTCTGLTALPKIAVTLAQALEMRRSAGNTKFLNILACENALGGSTILKSHVLTCLPEEGKTYLEQYIGFPDCAIDGIIPPNANSLPADVTAEEYYEWDSLKSGFRGPLPEVEGLHIVDDLSPFLERKLFTLNGPNAVTGALGRAKGLETVQEALSDPEIYDLVWNMMEEAGQMLCLRHGFTAEEMLAYRSFIMDRFRNPSVIDSCARVAREPIRKLSPDDRLIAPMRYANAFGLPTPAYCRGIAALMNYDNPKDAQSRELQELIRRLGFGKALERITGIPENSEPALKITEEYRKIAGHL